MHEGRTGEDHAKHWYSSLSKAYLSHWIEFDSLQKAFSVLHTHKCVLLVFYSISLSVCCSFDMCQVDINPTHMSVRGSPCHVAWITHPAWSFLLKWLQDLQTNSLQSRHWRLLLTRNLKGCRQRMQRESLSLGWYSSSSLLVSSFNILVLSSLHEK